MSKFFEVVEEICLQDNRYKPDAYEFVLQGLTFTQNKLKLSGHVSGGQLALGLRDFAVNQYGGLAKTVLQYWGITRTQDFGNIVFNLIEKKLFSKTEEDKLNDFKQVYDFDAAFKDILQENMDQELK